MISTLRRILQLGAEFRQKVAERLPQNSTSPDFSSRFHSVPAPESQTLQRLVELEQRRSSDEILEPEKSLGSMTSCLGSPQNLQGGLGNSFSFEAPLLSVESARAGLSYLAGVAKLNFSLMAPPLAMGYHALNQALETTPVYPAISEFREGMRQAQAETLSAMSSLKSLALGAAVVGANFTPAGLYVDAALAGTLIKPTLDSARQSYEALGQGDWREAGRSFNHAAIGAMGIYGGLKAGLKGVKAASQPTPLVSIEPRKLQHAYDRHAPDLGIPGPKNKAALKAFEARLFEHTHNPNVVVVDGTHRGTIPVTHYFDPKTGINVMVNQQGKLEGVWKLDEKQKIFLKKKGNVQ